MSQHSYTLDEINEIQTEQYRPWGKPLRGAVVQWEDVDNRWQPYVCGLCWEPVMRDPYGLKQRGSSTRFSMWKHKISGVRWCKPNKQHGPKTRSVFPLPGLYVIEEEGLAAAL